MQVRTHHPNVDCVIHRRNQLEVRGPVRNADGDNELFEVITCKQAHGEPTKCQGKLFDASVWCTSSAAPKSQRELVKTQVARVSWPTNSKIAVLLPPLLFSSLPIA